MRHRRFKIYDDEIMILSLDHQAEELVLDVVSDEIDAWQNLNSARATHQAILFCSDEKLWIEHQEIEREEASKP